MRARKAQRTIGGKKYSPSNVYPFGTVDFGSGQYWQPKDLARQEAKKWADHLRKRGFRVRVIVTVNAYIVYERRK